MWLKPAILIVACIIPPFAMNHQSSESNIRQDTGQILQQLQSGDTTRNASLHRVLTEIQNGIINGTVNSFTPFIAPQIYLSLLNSDEGYFSSNQSSFILQHFFSSFRILTFRFTTVHSERLNTYATGGGTLIRKGSTEIIQIYLALRYRDGTWNITQFNMY